MIILIDKKGRREGRTQGKEREGGGMERRGREREGETREGRNGGEERRKIRRKERRKI